MNSSDQIWVAAGTYKPGTAKADTFNLVGGVAVLGGFLGVATEINPDDRDWQTNVTILSGDIDNDSVLDGDNSYHVVSAGSTVGFTSGMGFLGNLDGFTVKMGSATGTGTDQYKGGGIFIDQGSPRIRNCTITQNTTNFSGGGIECRGTMTPPEIRNCRIIGNTATTGSGRGGGINCNRAVTVINTKFLDNFAGKWGGALNTEYALEDHGLVTSDVILANCEFVGNSCDWYGGANYLDADGAFIVSNCLFNNNWCISTTQSNGGAVWTGQGVAATVTNCTFVHNHVPQGLGGGWADYSLQSSEFINCIFYDNTAGIMLTRDYEDNFGGLSVTHCAVQQPITGGTNIQLDTSTNPPGFVDNTQTNPVLNDYRLTCASPCVNAGSNSAVPDDTEDVDEDADTTEDPADLDFKPRIVTTADMGAYEKPMGCIADITGNGVVNVDDLLAVINAWGSCGPPCAADIAPAPCGGDATVNVDDLLALLNSWGMNCVTGGLEDVGSIDSVEDCMDAASLQFTPYSPEWDEAVEKCVEALCAAEIIDCD